MLDGINLRDTGGCFIVFHIILVVSLGTTIKNYVSGAKMILRSAPLLLLKVSHTSYLSRKKSNLCSVALALLIFGQGGN